MCRARQRGDPNRLQAVGGTVARIGETELGSAEDVRTVLKQGYCVTVPTGASFTLLTVMLLLAVAALKAELPPFRGVT